MTIKDRRIAFNAGELSPKIDSRDDLEKYKYGARRMENMIPTKYGGAERRPGTIWLGSFYGTSTRCRMMKFVYSATVVYKLEFGDRYIRVRYEDDVLLDDDSNEVVVTSPFTISDVFELQYHQIGDVLWLVHPNHWPQKLKRTSPTDFVLEDIDFRNGPFVTRNDLIDPTITNPAEVSCTSLPVGSYGSLLATNSIFLPEHVGSLFKLIHPRAVTIVEASGIADSDEIAVKGAFSFNTHGTWKGTVYLQRNENNSDWENFRTYKGNNDRNIQLSHVEESFSVKYRITSDSMTSKFKGEITLEEPNQEGIVKVTNVVNTKHAIVEVYAEVGSTGYTKKWAEGAWNAYRGNPAAITFYDDRCCYAGATAGNEDDTDNIDSYPELKALNF